MAGSDWYAIGRFLFPPVIWGLTYLAGAIGTMVCSVLLFVQFFSLIRGLQAENHAPAINEKWQLAASPHHIQISLPTLRIARLIWLAAESKSAMEPRRAARYR